MDELHRRLMYWKSLMGSSVMAFVKPDDVINDLVVIAEREEKGRNRRCRYDPLEGLDYITVSGRRYYSNAC